MVYRFRQFKEEEKKKKSSKALPVEEVQPLVSDSDDGSDVESNKVKYSTSSEAKHQFAS